MTLSFPLTEVRVHGSRETWLKTVTELGYNQGADIEHRKISTVFKSMSLLAQGGGGPPPVSKSNLQNTSPAIKNSGPEIKYTG